MASSDYVSVIVTVDFPCSETWHICVRFAKRELFRDFCARIVELRYATCVDKNGRSQLPVDMPRVTPWIIGDQIYFKSSVTITFRSAEDMVLVHSIPHYRRLNAI